jgi:hypothetical protein
MTSRIINWNNIIRKINTYTKGTPKVPFCDVMLGRDALHPQYLNLNPPVHLELILRTRNSVHATIYGERLPISGHYVPVDGDTMKLQERRDGV